MVSAPKCFDTGLPSSGSPLEQKVQKTSTLIQILFYFILLRAFVGWYIECKTMPCVSNTRFRTAPTLVTVIAVYCIARRHLTAHRRRNLRRLTVMQRLLCASQLEPRAGTVRGSNPWRDKRCSSFPNLPDRLCGPPSLLLNWHRISFSGVERPGRKVVPSPP